MDERCSSYIDFAVNGMMNESRGAKASEFQRCTHGEREREKENTSELAR